MQAVIKTGGKQYLVKPDQTLKVELIEDAGKEVELEALLVIDGDKVKVGMPKVEGVKVKAKVLGEVKADKIRVLKFKAKKRQLKQSGHRQKLHEIKITSIG